MKRRQKSKMTMLIVGGLAAVSLVSVGFANWVIIGAAYDTENVTVSAGKVENNSLTTTVYNSSQGSDLSLNFDNVSGGGSNGIFDKTGGSEDLVFSIKFKIEGAVATKLNTVEFTFDEGIAGTSTAQNPLTDLTNTNDAVDYLCYPWISTRKVDFTYSSTGKTFTYKSGKNDDSNAVAPTIAVSTSETGDSTLIATATFTFKWGKAFGYVNPGNSTIDRDTLISRLKLFDTAFKNATASGKTLSVTVTPTVK